MIRRNKAILFGVLIFSIFLINGCSFEVATLTEEENRMVAEYISSRILKHDGKNGNKLEYNVIEEHAANEPPEATEPPQINQKPEETQETDHKQLSEEEALADVNTPEPMVSFNDIYNDCGIEVSYVKSNLYSDQFVVNSAFTIPAKDGMKLLVVDFKLKNIANKKNSIDLYKKNIRYSLQTQEKEYVTGFTLLDNDLSQFSATLKKGGSKNTVLVFDVPSNFVIEGSKLVIKRDGKTANVELT